VKQECLNSDFCGGNHKKMNNFLIENELGYTNHYNGKYITEDNATHIAVYVDDALVIKEHEKASLEQIIMSVMDI
jgi:hypothetical protein